MATYKKWTNEEIEYIRNNHTNEPDKYLAAKLSKITGSNITTSMIRRQRRKLKLVKPRGRPLKDHGDINLSNPEQQEAVTNL